MYESANNVGVTYCTLRVQSSRGFFACEVQLPHSTAELLPRRIAFTAIMILLLTLQYLKLAAKRVQSLFGSPPLKMLNLRPLLRSAPRAVRCLSTQTARTTARCSQVARPASRQFQACRIAPFSATHARLQSDGQGNPFANITTQDTPS